MIELSVIIPTYNRSEMLIDVLSGLLSQDADPARFEVIVLDDGSTDDTASIVGTYERGALTLRYVHQENAGLNNARNHAARVAEGPLLAYLDDDVRVPPDYVSQVLAAFEANPDADAMAGRILLDLEASPPPWLTGGLRLYLSEFDRGDTPEVLSPPEYPRGANFAVRADTLERLGGFHPLLDRRGGSLISGGEQELFQRLHAAGGVIVSWPAAWVHHRVPAERLTLDWFRRRAQAQGTSDALLEGTRRSAATIGREIVRAARTLPILARGVATGKGTVNARLWVAYCRGRAAAVLARESA